MRGIGFLRNVRKFLPAYIESLPKRHSTRSC